MCPHFNLIVVFNTKASSKLYTVTPEIYSTFGLTLRSQNLINECMWHIYNASVTSCAIILSEIVEHPACFISQLRKAQTRK